MKATQRYLRISPRKVRLVADVVRGKNVREARTVLRVTQKRGSHHILKLLDSALANAKDVGVTQDNDLYVSRIFVDEGPKLKRFLPRARGMATPLQKKMSHVTIELNHRKAVVKDEHGA